MKQPTMIHQSSPWPVGPAILHIVVAGTPVTTNHMYATSGRISKAGRVHYRTADCVAWEDAVCFAARASLVRHPVRFFPPLFVFFCFVGVSGDVTNYLKSAEDGLKLGIGIDDQHFHPVAVDKRRKRKGEIGGVIIDIWNGPDRGPGGDAA